MTYILTKVKHLISVTVQSNVEKDEFPTNLFLALKFRFGLRIINLD